MPPQVAVAPEPVGAMEHVEQPDGEAPPAVPSLRDRWETPFAVVSRGEPAPHETRFVIVAPSKPAPASPRGTGKSEPAAVRAPEPPEPSSREAESSRDSEEVYTHRVRWGETWYGLARRFGVSPTILQVANPEVDPESLRAGVLLRIPAASASAQGPRTHEVRPGDTLWELERRYGVPAEKIRAANDLQGDQLRIGERLIIPQVEENR